MPTGAGAVGKATGAAGRRRTVLACAALALCVAPASAIAAGGYRSAAGFKGVWVATGGPGKIVLRLRGTGTRYRGTYATVRHVAGKTRKKVVRVTARTSAADGAHQLTLTFTKTKRSALCGLVGTRLYCQVGTAGPTVFVRR